MPVSDELGFFRELGVTNVGAISPKLETIGWDPAVFADAGLPRVEHRYRGTRASARRSTSRPRSAPTRSGAPRAASVRARGRKRPTSSASGSDPRRTPAKELGVALAIEPTNPLRTDISFVFNLRDSLVLARSAGIGVVLELACCWYERGLAELVRDNVDMLALVQVSDYEIGTFDTPNRSVIGDGDVPLERLHRDGVGRRLPTACSISRSSAPGSRRRATCRRPGAVSSG